ncbi:ATP-binding protein [Reichenbachiella sp. MALMAid0571]|uniref:hybrid sensor histidine kinase/response regulator n=1 Tax=Reichenbachiella sp. MALMAid0571 TaxID=3143939 RepID=UPI0032DEB2DE
MQYGKVKFWNSFVIRFGIFFVALIVFAILVSGYLVYTESSTVISDYSKERIKHTSNLAKKSFYALLDEVSNDIAVISENPVIENFVQSPSEKTAKNLQKMFEVILKNKLSYFQIRLLSIADNGKEVVRYDKVNNQVFQIAEEKLQYKGDKEYFKEALNTKKGEFYFSPINLNEEFGIISSPFTPTLRAASLIFDQTGTPINVLVINVDVSGFYDELEQIMQTDIKLVITDENDQYLFAPNMAKCFGKQLHNEESFKKDFNKNMQEVTHSASKEFDLLQDGKGLNYLYHLEELSYFYGQRKIYLLSIVEERLVLQSAHNVREKSFKIVLVICLLALILSFLFTQIFSKRISRITRAISSYEEGKPIDKKLVLSEKRKDEIGVLARAFIKMKSKIDQQVEDLKISLDKEHKAIKERDKFLQNMSHELRTPLNSILGLTQLLHKNQPAPKQVPIIDSLSRSAKNLEGLMYDILDHQKLIEGKVIVKYQPCNIHELLHDIHTSYQFEAIRKSLKFELLTEDDFKLNSYLSDPLRLTQIVTNLVVNAIKYTNKGEINLIAKVNKNTGSQFEVIVSDTGIGISPENIEKIKERFYREKEEISDRYTGYGLGLSIVKQLTDLFGGTLDVKSQKEKGSVFKVSLPLVAAETNDNTKSTPDKEMPLPQLQATYTILHIEDDISGRQLVNHILNIKNIDLIQTDNIENVADLLQQHAPDLIISDLMIDNVLIEKALNGIKQKHPLIPIVVVSAFDREQMFAISPFFLQKPFDVNNLLDNVFVLLGKNEYDIPNLTSSYEQYDFNKEKIENFLSMLHNEFNHYISKIETVYQSKNQKEWESIMHKIITHIKSMNLTKLSEVLPEKIQDLDITSFTNVINILSYCLCYFRVEKLSNSAN